MLLARSRPSQHWQQDSCSVHVTPCKPWHGRRLQPWPSRTSQSVPMACIMAEDKQCVFSTAALLWANRAGLQQHRPDALGSTRPTCAPVTAAQPQQMPLHTRSPVQWVQQRSHSKCPSTPAHLCSGYSSTLTASARSSAGSGRGSRAYCSAVPALTREARTQATLAAKKKLAALRLAADPFLSMALTWQRSRWS